MKPESAAPVPGVTIGGLTVGLPGTPLLIAGPCVMESGELCMTVAAEASRLARRHGFSYIFKGSFDKANRSSLTSKRGPGMEKGLALLAEVRERFGVPVLTDVHETFQVEAAAAVADVLQIPAFLCRQTDLILAAAATRRAVNIKKGQFVSPDDMGQAVEKAISTGDGRVLLTERGTFFGYGRLVVDMAGMARMRALGRPVIFDATHSVQRPGGAAETGGDRDEAVTLARAAAAAGCDGLFMEVHPRPAEAWSDKATSLTFELLDRALAETGAIFKALGRVRP